MFFKRRNKLDDVRPGAIFERTCPHNLIEVAEVTWVGTGPCGVPHVRYQMFYRRPDQQDTQGDRILALDCFAQRYPSMARAGA